MICELLEDGYCVRHDVRHVGRLKELALDEGPLGESYRKMWDGLKKPLVSTLPCAHLGEVTGETVQCPSCRGTVLLKLFECGVYGQCTLKKDIEGVACCNGTKDRSGRQQSCPSYSPLTESAKALLAAGASSPESSPTPAKVSTSLRWAYGVTTVLARRDNLLPLTLASLKKAGFDSPRLFVDGDKWNREWERFGLELTFRYPTIRTAANWILALWELYTREPLVERYAVFQDDFVTYTNLRAYLDACPYPDKGYLNLYTFPSEQARAKGDGWYASNQNGRGAVALVFNREAVVTLLSQLHLVERPQDQTRGHKAIDGGVVESMKKAGWKEYVHNPSLVQHTGLESSMGNKPHKQALSFRGEGFDALELLKKS